MQRTEELDIIENADVNAQEILYQFRQCRIEELSLLKQMARCIYPYSSELNTLLSLFYDWIVVTKKESLQDLLNDIKKYFKYS